MEILIMVVVLLVDGIIVHVGLKNIFDLNFKLRKLCLIVVYCIVMCWTWIRN